MNRSLTGLVSSKLPGILLLIGSIQFAILMVIAEAIYPGYNTSTNFISDLGVWGTPSAALFNPSIVLLGSLSLISSYFIKKHFKLGKIAYLFALGAIGTLIVGLFPENTVLIGDFPLIHGIAAFLAFTMNASAAIAAYTYTKTPFKFVSIVLGIVSIVSFVLFLTTAPYGSLGIGYGGMERMIVYPSMLWVISFSGYLLGLPDDTS